MSVSLILPLPDGLFSVATHVQRTPRASQDYKKNNPDCQEFESNEFEWGCTLAYFAFFLPYYLWRDRI